MKKGLVLGIIALFIVSAVTPMVIGYNVSSNINARIWDDVAFYYYDEGDSLNHKYGKEKFHRTISNDEETIGYYDEATAGSVCGGMYQHPPGPPYQWETAIRFTQVELAPYAGWNITGVNVLHCEDEFEHWGEIKIYGEGTPTMPGSLITNESYHFDAQDWFRVDLSELVLIDEHNEIWVSVWWESWDDDFPAAMDFIEAVDGKGDWIYWNQTVGWQEAQDWGSDHNWCLEAIVEGLNQPPTKPNITGPHYGRPGVEYTFCIDGIVDPDGDDLYCMWDWGDGNFSDWLGPYGSGGTMCASHAWPKEGTYTIRVKLKDVFGAVSESDPHVIVIEAESPNLEILKPHRGVYIFNYKILRWPFFIGIIIGDIDIIVNASDEISGVERVEFYIDGVLKANITNLPFTFLWMRDGFRFIHLYGIKVVAYDKAGNSAKHIILVRRFF